MTRDELEAVIWRPFTDAGAIYASEEPVSRILAAADEYARHVGGITAERRAVLADATVVERRQALASAVHFDDQGPACRIPGAQQVSADPGDVTCGLCKSNRAYQRQLAAAS